MFLHSSQFANLVASGSASRLQDKRQASHLPIDNEKSMDNGPFGDSAYWLHLFAFIGNLFY